MGFSVLHNAELGKREKSITELGGLRKGDKVMFTAQSKNHGKRGTVEGFKSGMLVVECDEGIIMEDGSTGLMGLVKPGSPLIKKL